MKKRTKDIITIVKKEGVELEEIKTNGSGHLVATVRAPNGATDHFIFSKTPTCARGDKNKISDLRRFVRSNTSSPNSP